MSIIINNKDDLLTINIVDNSNTIDHIPAMVYTVSYNPMSDKISLHKDRKRFEVPQVVYGAKHKRHLSLITNEFNKSERAVGAILHGLKGSGKSMLAEAICNTAITMDYPVFMIDTPVPPHVILLLSKITTGCVFYFDEFCKVYRHEDVSASMLPVFSDSSLTKTLFLVCDNDIRHFNTYLVNRPGRFLFNIKHTGIGSDVINELCDIHSIDDAIRAELLVYIGVNHVSMDVVNTLIRFAKLSSNVAELLDYMTVLNVPSVKYVKVAGSAACDMHISQVGSRYGVITVDAGDIRMEVYEAPVNDGKLNLEQAKLISDKTISVAALVSDMDSDYVRGNGCGITLNDVRFTINVTECDIPAPDSYTVYDGGVQPQPQAMASVYHKSAYSAVM